MASRTSKPSEYILTRPFWLRLHVTLQHLRQPRVPQILQMSAVECGVACLAMVLNSYGRQTAVSEIREHCGIGHDGFSAHTLAHATRQYGFRVCLIDRRFL